MLLDAIIEREIETLTGTEEDNGAYFREVRDSDYSIYIAAHRDNILGNKGLE